MTRLFYIILAVSFIVSCSGNNPIRYYKSVKNSHSYPFIIEYGALPHDSFPLHYEDKTNETENPDEESYYIIRNSGDTLIWEEGMIRGE